MACPQEIGGGPGMGKGTEGVGSAEVGLGHGSNGVGWVGRSIARGTVMGRYGYGMVRRGRHAPKETGGVGRIVVWVKEG